MSIAYGIEVDSDEKVDLIFCYKYANKYFFRL